MNECGVEAAETAERQTEGRKRRRRRSECCCGCTERPSQTVWVGLGFLAVMG